MKQRLGVTSKAPLTVELASTEALVTSEFSLHSEVGSPYLLPNSRRSHQHIRSRNTYMYLGANLFIVSNEHISQSLTPPHLFLILLFLVILPSCLKFQLLFVPHHFSHLFNKKSKLQDHELKLRQRFQAYQHALLDVTDSLASKQTLKKIPSQILNQNPFLLETQITINSPTSAPNDAGSITGRYRLGGLHQAYPRP